LLVLIVECYINFYNKQTIWKFSDICKKRKKTLVCSCDSKLSKLTLFPIIVSFFYCVVFLIQTLIFYNPAIHFLNYSSVQFTGVLSFYLYFVYQNYPKCDSEFIYWIPTLTFLISSNTLPVTVDINNELLSKFKRQFLSLFIPKHFHWFNNLFQFAL